MKILYLEYVKKECHLNSKTHLDFVILCGESHSIKNYKKISYLKNIKSPSKRLCEFFLQNKLKLMSLLYNLIF